MHGAQGATVGTCHVVLTGAEDRNLLYVALSRGQLANHLYLAIGSDGDPHTLIRPEALIPPTALDQLAQILRHDGSAVSATTAWRESTDPARLLHDTAARYHDALTTGAEQLIGPAGLARIDQRAAILVEGLTDAAAWPTLRAHLALLALDDHNPLHMLTDAVHAGSLTEARDPAAVLDARIDQQLNESTAGGADRGHSTTRTGKGGPLPWLPGIPARLADDLDWGAYLTARHQQVLDHAATVTDLAHAWTPNFASTAPAWAQPFLEDPDADLRAELALWRAATDTPDTDLRPTGEPTIGSPGDHQTILKRAVRKARPSYPFAQRSWYQALPETVRTDPWITPLCQRLARLERAGLPVSDYLTQALSPGLVGADGGRPLPDQHQAAALWWRLAPHLGPAALDADANSGDLLAPAWSSTLTDLVGGPRADYSQRSPSWPALVAAVDESCHHQGWSPRQILAAALDGIPDDGTLSGVEVADALVLRIAALTDPPDHQAPNFDELDGEAAGPLADPIHQIANDPYAEGLPRTATTQSEIGSEFAFPDPGQVSAVRILELNQQALDHYQSRYPLSWAPGYLRERIGTDLVGHPTYSAGFAPPGPRSLLTHLTDLGATLEELEQAGLIRTRERRDGSTEYVDVFRDRLMMPIRDPHEHDGHAVIGFVGRRNPTKGDDDYAGPKYLNTKTTPVFTKGQALFGYAETRDALSAGALPVLVEGPLDAYAITLGSGGTAVGLAPMGTALTTDQIKIVRRHLSLADSRDHIAVATDADPAGWKAAQAAFWNLTAADLDPTHLALPDGLDPANLFETGGAPGVQAAIKNRIPLGDVMLDHVLRTAGHWSDPGVRQQIVEQAARVLAARGPDTWTDSITLLNHRLQLSTGILEHHTLTESIERAHDLAGYTANRIAELHEQTRGRIARRQRSAAWTATHAAQAILTPEHDRSIPTPRRDRSGPSR